MAGTINQPRPSYQPNTNIYQPPASQCQPTYQRTSNYQPTTTSYQPTPSNQYQPPTSFPKYQSSSSVNPNQPSSGQPTFSQPTVLYNMSNVLHSPGQNSTPPVHLTTSGFKTSTPGLSKSTPVLPNGPLQSSNLLHSSNPQHQTSHNTSLGNLFK